MKNITNHLKRKKISKNIDVQSHKNNNIRKDFKKVYNVIYRASDDVTDHEEYERLLGTEDDIKEYINVMVYQEESFDVDSYYAVVDTKCSKTV